MDQKIKSSFTAKELTGFVLVHAFFREGLTLDDDIQIAEKYVQNLDQLGYDYRLSLIEPPELYIHETDLPYFIANQKTGTIPDPKTFSF